MNENIPSQRNWFPVIVAGLTILLAMIFYAAKHQAEIGAWTQSIFDRSATTSLSEPAVTDAQYQAAVQNVMTAYREDNDAQDAYDVLILLQVPSDMQTFHLLLVIAFGKLADGGTTNVADGMARLDALQQQYSWFTL